MARAERKGRIKKRGKKGGKKETPEEDTQILAAGEPMDTTETPAKEQRPDGIVFNEQHFQAAHFGEVEEEMLGYFKNVEQTLDEPPFETGEGKNMNKTFIDLTCFFI
jgi:nucleolar protein 9